MPLTTRRRKPLVKRKRLADTSTPATRNALREGLMKLLETVADEKGRAELAEKYARLEKTTEHMKRYWYASPAEFHAELLKLAAEMRPVDQAGQVKTSAGGRSRQTYISEGVRMKLEGRSRKEILRDAKISPFIKPKTGETQRDAESRFMESVNRRARRERKESGQPVQG